MASVDMISEAASTQPDWPRRAAEGTRRLRIEVAEVMASRLFGLGGRKDEAHWPAGLDIHQSTVSTTLAPSFTVTLRSTSVCPPNVRGSTSTSGCSMSTTLTSTCCDQ